VDFAVRSDATEMLKEQRRLLAKRPEAIRRVMLTAGRAYQRTVVNDYMSGRGGKLGGLSEAALAGLTPRQRAKQAGIARARLDTNPLTAGRAMGLNRRSKQAAAGWVVTARIEGDTIRLVVGNRVPYVRFHTDTYRPKGYPRRNPIRLPTGRLWQEHMTSQELARAIGSAGFGDA
jgi:hypothetical protein